MKLVLDEWIVREVIDTLYMARTTFLGITGLDSPQEVAKKSANETAITRRISKAIDIIQQQEQPSEWEGQRTWIGQPYVSLEKEYEEYVDKDPVFGKLINHFAGIIVARHFYELGKKSK